MSVLSSEKGRSGRRYRWVMEILRTVYLKCTPPNIHHFDFLLSVFVKYQIARAYLSKRRNRQRAMSCGRYAVHALFVPPAPAPDDVFDGAAAPARDPISILKPCQTLSIVTEWSFPWGGLWQNHGPTRRLRFESVGRGVGARPLVRVWH
jgi:hypothetical protein